MNLILKKFRSLRIGWNKKPIGEEKVYKLAKRLKVRIKEMPLRVPGFYMSLRGVDFICVDERLPPALKLKIKLHELAHHILHTGVPHFYHLDQTMKEECEADIFALCALIPKSWMKKTITELIEIDGFDMETLQERSEISETYKFYKI